MQELKFLRHIQLTNHANIRSLKIHDTNPVTFKCNRSGFTSRKIYTSRTDNEAHMLATGAEKRDINKCPRKYKV